MRFHHESVLSEGLPMILSTIIVCEDKGKIEERSGLEWGRVQ
jgi:hypothetical protein